MNYKKKFITLSGATLANDTINGLAKPTIFN